MKRSRSESEPFVSNISKIDTLKDLIVIGEEYRAYFMEQEKNINEWKKELLRSRKKRKNMEKKMEEYDESLKEIIHKNKDYEKLKYIVEDLRELDSLIGLESLKKSIVNQILFFIQGLNDKEFLHTCIFGPPGTGKTLVCKILANIYKNLGFLSNGTLTIATRADMVAGYLGQSALKTKKLLDSSKGGVLLIDEVYSLGDKEGRDSFAKEVIDTLNQYLSENSKDFLCIIAGYEEEVKNCFFGMNQGLDRRFPWKFYIDKYDSKELKQILLYQIKNDGWTYIDEFEKAIDLEQDSFEFSGGSCLILFEKIKFYHARRVFGKEHNYKKVLVKEDYTGGFALYKEYLNKSKEKDMVSESYMYI